MVEHEYIKDEHELYRFIHKTYIKGNEISKSSFKIEMFRISVDWDKRTQPPYNPHYTRARNGDPIDYAVIGLITGDVRTEGFNAEHTPDKDNEAHSDIIIPEEIPLSQENKIKTILRNLSFWKIRFGDPI